MRGGPPPGSSLPMRSDICLLKGELFWLRPGKPRNEPCRARASAGAWRRGMACGPSVAADSGGEEPGEDELPDGGPEEPLPLEAELGGGGAARGSVSAVGGVQRVRVVSR